MLSYCNVSLFSICLLTSALFLVVGCADPSQPGAEDKRPDFDRLQVFSMNEQFRISSFGSDEFFSSVSYAAAGADGTIFVSDDRGSKIYMFGQKGDYKGYLGGVGSGPGEFRQIGHVSLLTPDTLQVVDWRNDRITFFAVKDESWTAVRYLDRPRGSRDYGSDIFFNFNSLIPIDGGYLARFKSSFTPVDTSMHSIDYFTFVDYNLKPLDDREYFWHVASDAVVERVTTPGGGSVSMMTIPEGRRTLSTMTADGRLVSSWTADNRITIRDISGEDSTSFSFPSKRMAITETEKNEMAVQHIPDPGQSRISRDRLTEKIPDYRGFARQLVMDDRGYIWVLVRPFEEDDPEWLVYSKQGELIAAAPHPGGNVTQIKDDRMYVIFTSMDDEPAFGVYELQ